MLIMLHLSQQELELTEHQRPSKMTKKLSPNSNCKGVSAEFLQVSRERSKTVMMRFGDVIIRVII